MSVLENWAGSSATKTSQLKSPEREYAIKLIIFDCTNFDFSYNFDFS